MTVKEALLRELKCEERNDGNLSEEVRAFIERVGINEKEWDRLANVTINEQHLEKMIIEVITNYPSLIRELVSTGAGTITFALAHGQMKPVMKESGGKAVVFLNS